MQIHVVDSFFGFVEVRFKRSYQGRNIWDDPIIEKSQDQDQGQGQDQVVRQRSALRQQMVDGLGPDPGPGPELFQLSGRPRHSIPDKFS